MLGNFEKHPTCQSIACGDRRWWTGATNPNDVVRKVRRGGLVGKQGWSGNHQHGRKDSAEPGGRDRMLGSRGDAATAAAPERREAPTTPAARVDAAVADPNELKPNVEADPNALPPLQQSNQLETAGGSFERSGEKRGAAIFLRARRRRKRAWEAEPVLGRAEVSGRRFGVLGCAIVPFSLSGLLPLQSDLKTSSFPLQPQQARNGRNLLPCGIVDLG